MVITDAPLREDAELPPLQKQDVKVKQGKNFLQVTQLIPAQGDNTALQLMILIDDTLNTSIGNNLNDIKEFVSAQPASTLVGIGYMSNTGVNIVQTFTPDKDSRCQSGTAPTGQSHYNGQPLPVAYQLSQRMAATECPARRRDGDRRN